MIPGTVLVQSVIAPSSEEDIYPTHKAKWGLGSYRTVESIEERDEISAERREAGMLAYVVEERKIYMLDHDLITWLDFAEVLAALIAPFLNLQPPPDNGGGGEEPPPDNGGGEEPPPDDGGGGDDGGDLCPVCIVPATTTCIFSSLQPPPGGACGLDLPIPELCAVCGADASVTTICPINSDNCGLGLTEPPPDDGGGEEPPPDGGGGGGNII